VQRPRDVTRRAVERIEVRPITLTATAAV